MLSQSLFEFRCVTSRQWAGSTDLEERVSRASKTSRIDRMRVILSCIVIGMSGLISGVSSGDDVRFNDHIRPLLAEYCLECHGPDSESRAGDLRLDVEQDAKKLAIVEGNPGKSSLFERIASTDPESRMPPTGSGKSLSPQQIDLLKRWILEGAPYQGHWAFEAIEKPAVPETADSASTEIDRFVVRALESKGLNLSPRIGRERLIRRATFDLIGLPPTWEEVAAFVADESPHAYASLIDRLLKSPRYGERWGRHWLDIARYADTHGGSAIGYTKFPFSYTYRDYVIAAFNDDLPYDQFITQQIAADQLGLDEGDSALAGLGFLTVGMQHRSRHDLIDDQIDVVTRGLMGLTVACARCHDHKFDPIPTADYYGLYATLASSRSPDVLPVIGDAADSEAFQNYSASLAQRQVVYENMSRDQSSVMRGRLRMQVGMYLRELAKGTPEQDLSAAFLSYRTDDVRPIVLNRWRDYMAAMPASDPVFGPWVQLANLDAKNFQNELSIKLTEWRTANGDAAKFADVQKFSVAAPRWNPRVLDALEKHAPTSMLDVASVYGELFATVHREWLTGLLDAANEAADGAALITDQDARHAAINSSINSQLRRHLYQPGTPTAMPDELATTMLNRTVRDGLNGKKRAIHNLHLSSPGSPPRAMVLEEQSEPDEYHILRRGNPIDRGETVQASFLTALSNGPKQTFPNGRRRLSLAEKIVATDNPLSRRVVVNWIWQHHFGKGLVRTPDDFGTRGEPPTHPQLLDYLAETFLSDGWSIKKLHRRIMLSETYQQAAIESSSSREIDPDNRLLWRMPRRRLDMESMRDAMLAVSGELNVSVVGGRPFNFMSNPVVPRRSVYGFVNRDILSSLATTFDRADPSSCTAKRPDTSVPQQTLFALNSEFIQQRAAALAKLSLVEKAPAMRVRWIMRRAYGRDAAPQEIEAALAYIDSQASEPKHDPWQLFAHVLLASNEFIFLD